ncbi:unnamed protein product, partial [Polarella glacialis]
MRHAYRRLYAFIIATSYFILLGACNCDLLFQIAGYQVASDSSPSAKSRRGDATGTSATGADKARKTRMRPVVNAVVPTAA